MISIILYGRNDSYGYNLHKRAVMSLNCMAAVLQDEDEIIFVDYNTPDDFPSFPEAVYDNLTEQARERLRILRVRSDVHRLHAGNSHLFTNEPLARNIALRRSDPSNRWILSTNTDLIFAPLHQPSLTTLARDLADGIYCTPRIEIPETLWESLDRRDPSACIRAVAGWGSGLHLDEIVYGIDDILFDAPGDFQLMLRKDLFDIDGFDERMTLGWHVDANISRRLRMLYGTIGDLSGSVLGYHCDHTRQVTPMHRHGGVQNDLVTFVDAVIEPDLPDQRESWGCAGEEIEEIRLLRSPGQRFLSIMSAILTEPLAEPLRVAYRPETYNRTMLSPEHALPFLVDIFSSAPRNWSIGWIGIQPKMLQLFRQAWLALGFTGDILVYAGEEGLADTLAGEQTRAASLPELTEQAQAIVFDFSTPDGAPLSAAVGQEDRRFGFRFALAFRKLAIAEREAMAEGRNPRRFVGLNAVHNTFERVITAEVGAARTPFSLRLRHGFVLPVPLPLQWGTDDWLPHMTPGPGGVREGEGIRSTGEPGHVAFGPYALMWPGHYRLSADIRCMPEEADTAGIIVEVASDRRFIIQRALSGEELSGLECELEFEIAEEDWDGFRIPEVEFRVWSPGRAQTVQVTRVAVDQLTSGGR